MSEEREFTLEELEGFDGKDGRPAYFAVDGIVYDASASPLWRGGNHVRTHNAGEELSKELLVAPHPKDRLDRLPRVGVLLGGPPVMAEPEPEDEVPGFAALAYKLHAHPASVHFPIALCFVASALQFLALVLDNQTLATVALYNLVIGLAAAPASIISGLLDWRYQFAGRLTSLFIWKIALSGLFLLTGAAALAAGLLGGDGGLVYDLLVISLAPMVMALGFIGGRITFPS